jgi:hypothetical protein
MQFSVFDHLTSLPPGCSLAVPLDAKQLLFSGNLLVGGPLCACTMPVSNTAAGSATLAAEPAVFDLDS